jgi:hypothetical protein
MRRFYWWTKAILIAVFFLSFTFVRADCPISVKCSIDGQMMLQEETYYNGGHKSVKYSHDYYGPNGKEHHYIVVSCDDY